MGEVQRVGRRHRHDEHPVPGRAGEWLEGTTILDYGAAIAQVIGALSLAVYVFGRATHGMEEAKRAAAVEAEEAAAARETEASMEIRGAETARREP